jgi:hypothetical protein
MSETTVDSPYLTAAEAAQYLRYPSTHWFRVSVRKYGIPSIRRGRRMFFTRQVLDEFMAVASEATNPKRGRKKGKAA